MYNLREFFDLQNNHWLKLNTHYSKYNCNYDKIFMYIEIRFL